MKRSPWLGSYAVIYLVFLYAPILILPLFAFNDSRIVAFPLQGFTTRWFVEMWEDRNLRTAVWNSLIIALSTATLATTLGVFAARASVRYAWPGKPGIMGLIMLPLVLPEMIVAMALLVVLLSIGIPLSLFTVILGHVLVCTPFAVAILTSAFQGLDTSLEEAALDLGANPFQAFVKVLLPELTPAIMSGCLLAFVLSMDDLLISSFTAGGGANTLPMEIFSRVRTGVKPDINALSVLLILFSGALAFLSEYIRFKSAQRQLGK